MSHVYPGSLAYNLQAVENTADTPRPSTIGSHIRLVGIKTVDGLLSAFLRVRHHLAEVKGYLCHTTLGEYVPWQRTRSEPDAYDGGERSLTFRIDYRGCKPQCLAAHGNVHHKGIVDHPCLHLLLPYRRLFPYFIVV